MNNKLYERFDPEMDFSETDHIIIGSGIGGLTLAIWLAKAGEKVIVLERHYVPGGFTHSFKRKDGFQWDTGVHYVGNVGKEDSLRPFFNYITNNDLEWESMGDIYDVVYIEGDKYEFRAGKENFKKQILHYFPDEAKAIDDYLLLIDKVNKRGGAFFFEKTFKPILQHSIGKIIRKRFHHFSNKTTLETLKTLTTNERLIAVLCGQCGNYGLSPNYSSFAAHALVINHFLEGGYYPVGGTDQISFKAIKKLRSLGGSVYIKADVKEILTENNRVKGIRVKDRFIACKSVISNAGVNNTFNHLLKEKDRKRCNFDLQNVEPSSGHLCLYVGLDKSDEELKLPKHNIWYIDDQNIDKLMDTVSIEDTASRYNYISFPSAKDPQWKIDHPNTSTIQALAIGKYDWFSDYEESNWSKRGDSYLHLKKEFEIGMLDQLYKLFPQIKGHVVKTEVSSPLSTKHFSNYKHGEIYGLAHTPKRFTLPFLRPETKIKGLKLVGQDVLLVGLASAMFSGVLCAISILKFRVWKIFKEINSDN